MMDGQAGFPRGSQPCPNPSPRPWPCFCRCQRHGHQSGPSSWTCRVGALQHPGLPRRGRVPDLQAGCSLSGLCPSGPSPRGALQPALFTAHTHASSSHQTSLTNPGIKLLRIQDSSRSTLNQSEGRSENRWLRDTV